MGFNKNEIPNRKELMTGKITDKGSKMQSFTEIANTLLARDYKGFGNQAMNAVIERNKIIRSIK